MPPSKRKATTVADGRRGKAAKQTEPDSIAANSSQPAANARSTRGGRGGAKAGPKSRGGAGKGSRDVESETVSSQGRTKNGQPLDLEPENDLKKESATANFEEKFVQPSPSIKDSVKERIEPAMYKVKVSQKVLLPRGSNIQSDIPGLDIKVGNQSTESIVTVPGTIAEATKNIYDFHDELNLAYIRLLYSESAFYKEGVLNKLKGLEKKSSLLEVARNCLPLSSLRVVSVKMEKIQPGVDKTADDLKSDLKTMELLELVMSYFAKIDKSSTVPSVSYNPVGVFGQFGHPDKYLRSSVNQSLAKTNPYIDPASILSVQLGSDESELTAFSSRIVASLSSEEGLVQARKQCERDSETVIPGQHIALQVTIPNDFVGAMIGKGGTKILEMQQNSGSAIVIDETVKQTPRGDERVMTCTGTPESNMAAAMLIYKRVEIEKQFQMRRS
jgi:hypothetical protein